MVLDQPRLARDSGVVNPAMVGAGARIGSGSVVCGGNTVGKGVVVGEGEVVEDDLPDGAEYFGGHIVEEIDRVV